MLSGGYKEFVKIRELMRKEGEKLAEKEFQKIKNIDQFSSEKKIYYQMLKSYFLSFDISEDAVKVALNAYNESKELDNEICQLDAGINLVDCYINNYQFDKAIKQLSKTDKFLEKLLHRKTDILDRKVIVTRFKANILVQKGDLEEAEKICLSALKLNEKVQDKWEEYLLYNFLIWIRFPQGRFDEILEYEKQKLKLAKELESKVFLSWSYDNMAATYQWRGDYDTALEYIHKTLKLGEELKLKRRIMMAKTRLALHHWYTGELDEAVELFDEIIPWRLNTNSVRINCFGYWNKSIVEWYKGDLDAAISSGTKAVELAIAMDDNTHQNTFSIFLGAIYFDKGKFDKALELCKNSIKDAKKYGEKFHIAFAYYVMAMVYQVKGELDLAWDYAQQSLKIRKEMKIIHHIIESLFSLIQILLDKNDLVQAKAYLTNLDKIVNENPRKRFLVINKIAHGMILKASPKLRDWIKAIDIFLEIVNGEIVTYSLTVIALIQLCELLIREFSISGEPEVLLELENYTEKLEDIAKKQQVYKLRIEACHIRILTLWLKAQYSIADVDIKKAKELLVKARDMADEEGLILLAEKIIQQQGQFYNRIDQWDEFIRKYYEFLKD